MEYEVVKYHPEFRDQVLELQRHLWSDHLVVNDQYMRWKYECNPYLDTPQIYLVLLQGQVVGMRGVFGSKWQVGTHGRELPGMTVGDLVIAPEHRDKGLFTKIMDFALADLADQGWRYLFNLSANPMTQLGAMTQGWRCLGIQERMFWSQTKNNKVHAVVDRLFNYKDKETPFAAFDRKVVGGHRGKNRKITLEQEPRPRQMAALVAGMEREGRLRHDKSSAYFRWRFANPLSTYRFLYWGELEGYLVLQASKKWDSTLVEVVDWEAANMRILAELLQAAIAMSRLRRLTMTTLRFEPQMADLLHSLGFELLAYKSQIEHFKPTILVRPVLNEMLKEAWTYEGIELMDPNNWDMRPIYSDGS